MEGWSDRRWLSMQLFRNSTIQNGGRSDENRGALQRATLRALAKGVHVDGGAIHCCSSSLPGTIYALFAHVPRSLTGGQKFIRREGGRALLVPLDQVVAFGTCTLRSLITIVV